MVTKKKLLDDLSRIDVMDDATVEMLRRKTPAERLAMCLEANRLYRLRMAEELQAKHPDWDDAAIQAEIARRFLQADGLAFDKDGRLVTVPRKELD
jgi:hypothetical protein